MTREYAPGIPSKEGFESLPEIKEPKIWKYNIHEHDATKRGLHWDLRLGDPETGHAHSWAMMPKLPKPGEHTMVVQQPTHTTKYMDWEGEIPQGTYGAGKVKIKEKDKIEIQNSKPDHISFNVYRGHGPEEFTLHHMGGKIWKLYNRTPTRDKHDLPADKPKYKETTIEKAINSNDEYIASAKIDDAHNLFYFPKAKENIRVVSYKESKRDPNKIIDHTHKVESIKDLKTPKSLENTIIRGGLYAIDPNTNKATINATLGGMLNSNVWKSRELQKQHGELIPVIYDVEKFKGKDVSKLPYKDKLEILAKVQEEFPGKFKLPDIAVSSEEKKKLIEDIKEGKHPETTEGVVLWNMLKHESPIKAKFFKEHDVYIRDYFPGRGKYKDNGVGGFTYSHTPDGPIVGECGTGLDDKLRRDMHNNPDKYKGMVATVSSQHKYEKTQALRVPAFKGFHLDKNSQERLDQIYK